MKTGTARVKNIQRLMIRSFKRYKSGEITEAQAYRENVMLSNILKAIDLTEQEERIANLEEVINKSRRR